MWLLLYSGGGDGRGFLRFGSTTGSSRVIQNKKRQVGILENKNDYTQHYISTMMDETRIKLYQVVMKHAGNEEDRQHTYFSIFFFLFATPDGRKRVERPWRISRNETYSLVTYRNLWNSRRVIVKVNRALSFSFSFWFHFIFFLHLRFFIIHTHLYPATAS